MKNSIAPYPILSETLVFEEEIKKSRFITYLAHAEGKDNALAYLQEIKNQHKAARHHCWAYIANAPKNSMKMGCSDDGEPKGTAGKPMLAVLQGLAVGEVVAVVVRYSGGIKLGTGGLVRAYSNGIQQLGKVMPLTEKRFYQHFKFECGYSDMATIETLILTMSAQLVEVNYLAFITAIIKIDCSDVAVFLSQLTSQTQGRVFAKKYSLQ